MTPLLWKSFSSFAVTLPYLVSALQLTHRANQRVACASLCPGAPAVVPAEPVQGAAEEADGVANLCAVSEPQQS